MRSPLNYEDDGAAGASRLRQRLIALSCAVISERRHSRDMLADILRNFGVRRMQIYTRPDEMDPMLDGQADLFLWDWIAPDWAMLKELSQPLGGWYPAVIIFEPLPSPERVAMAVAAGASSVIAKPFSASVVLSHMAHAIHRRSREALVHSGQQVLLD